MSENRFNQGDRKKSGFRAPLRQAKKSFQKCIQNLACSQKNGNVNEHYEYYPINHE